MGGHFVWDEFPSITGQAALPLRMTERDGTRQRSPARINAGISGGQNAKGRPFWSTVLAANILGVLAALALIWLPEVSLYWVGPTQVPMQSVLRARSTPALDRLAEIGEQPLVVLINPADMKDPKRLRELGEGVLKGHVKFAGAHMATLPFPFRASHLDAGSPGYALQTASLGTVRVLLGAYVATRDPRFLDAALQETLAFDQVDAWRLIPRGLLWNDHALAGRVPTLALLWSLVRQKTDLDPAAARAVLQLVDRTGARLAKRELYNSRTNHGIMQDIALVQLSVAFPTLPRADHFRTIGCTRLVNHMPYYISPEGPVLEHSAGYHEFGRELLTKAIRVFELSGCVVPPEWPALLARVTEYSHLLQRPDRTLPVYGNTDHAPLSIEEGVDSTMPPAPASRLYDVAGLSVLWRGTEAWPQTQDLSQTVVTWSNFPTRAHKHADDMAVVIWAQGRTWLTNSGYWPYSAEGFEQANGWRGSNAPHFQGESPRVPRETVLLGSGASPSVSVIDLERRLPGGASVRRQVIEVSGKTWIMLDSAAGVQRQPLESIWTTMPETEVRAVGEHQFLLRNTGPPATARMFFAGALASAPLLRLGNFAPFGGWIVRAGRPIPAPAIEVLQRADQSPVATVLKLGEHTAAIRLEDLGQGPTQWTIRVDSSDDGFVARRAKNTLSIQFADGREERVELVVPTDVEVRRRAIVSAYEAARREYPGVRELTSYRFRLTMLALILLVVQEAVIAATRRLSSGLVPALRAAASMAWLCFGFLAAFWYLR
jgi:hypothetical protein